MRADLLIEYGEHFQEVPAAIAERPFPEQNRVPACESQAYCFPEELPNGTLRFHFAIENPQGISAKAFAAILAETLSGVPLSEVAQVSDDIVYEFFGKNISMGKDLGLRSMLQMVTALAKEKLC